MRTDHGEHRNENGDIMCRPCRLSLSVEPKTIAVRKHYHKTIGQIACGNCQKMHELVKELREMGIIV